MSLTYETQLEMTGIVNELIYAKSETFDPEKAKRLKDILLVDCELKPKHRFRVSINFPSFFNKILGYSPGVGNASLNNSENKSIRLGYKHRILCGNWDLSLNPKATSEKLRIDIQKRFDETRAIKEQEGYALYFQYDDPTKMIKVEWRSIDLKILEVDTPKPVPFKLPAHTCSLS